MLSKQAEGFQACVVRWEGAEGGLKELQSAVRAWETKNVLQQEVATHNPSPAILALIVLCVSSLHL